jgi:hypothetical protein
MACVPSFGLTNPDNLTEVIANPPSNNPASDVPPPALLSNAIPDWQQTPELSTLSLTSFGQLHRIPGGIP